MIERSRSLQYSAAFLVLAVNIFTLGGCSSSTGSTAMAPTLEPNNKSASSTYITVDDPACTGTCANEVTGINDGRAIVGNYSNCSGAACVSASWACVPHTSTSGGGCRPCPLLGGNAQWNSFTSTYSGGYSSFAPDQYPDAPQGQYMYALSDAIITIGARLNGVPSSPNAIKVGCINPFAGGGSTGEENGHWALLDNNGLWSVHDAGGAASCDLNNGPHDAVEELLGYDQSDTLTPTAVGFYSANNCDFIAAETQAGGNWKPLTVNLGSFVPVDVMATGITGSGTATNTGDIVGIATSNSISTGHVGHQVGWFSGLHTTYFHSGSIATAFTGIAKVGTTYEIVGWYTMPAQGVQPAVTHGLVATQAGTGFSVSPIDEPQAVGLTMINGINSNGDICGVYTDSLGKYHGFVGLGVVTAARKRHQHVGTRADRKPE